MFIPVDERAALGAAVSNRSMHFRRLSLYNLLPPIPLVIPIPLVMPMLTKPIPLVMPIVSVMKPIPLVMPMMMKSIPLVMPMVTKPIRYWQYPLSCRW